MWYTSEEHFKDENGYVINNVWHPRVTRILDIKAKPALENFFKEVGNYESAEEVKDKSAEEGSIVHGAVQSILGGMRFEVTKDTEPVAKAIQEFNKDNRISFHPNFIEYSMKYLPFY